MNRHKAVHKPFRPPRRIGQSSKSDNDTTSPLDGTTAHNRAHIATASAFGARPLATSLDIPSQSTQFVIPETPNTLLKNAAEYVNILRIGQASSDAPMGHVQPLTESVVSTKELDPDKSENSQHALNATRESDESIVPSDETVLPDQGLIQAVEILGNTQLSQDMPSHLEQLVLTSSEVSHTIPAGVAAEFRDFTDVTSAPISEELPVHLDSQPIEEVSEGGGVVVSVSRRQEAPSDEFRAVDHVEFNAPEMLDMSKRDDTPVECDKAPICTPEDAKLLESKSSCESNIPPQDIQQSPENNCEAKMESPCGEPRDETHEENGEFHALESNVQVHPQRHEKLLLDTVSNSAAAIGSQHVTGTFMEMDATDASVTCSLIVPGLDVRLTSEKVDDIDQMKEPKEESEGVAGGNIGFQVFSQSFLDLVLPDIGTDHSLSHDVQESDGTRKPSEYVTSMAVDNAASPCASLSVPTDLVASSVGMHPGLAEASSDEMADRNEQSPMDIHEAHTSPALKIPDPPIAVDTPIRMQTENDTASTVAPLEEAVIHPMSAIADEDTSDSLKSPVSPTLPPSEDPMSATNNTDVVLSNDSLIIQSELDVPLYNPVPCSSAVESASPPKIIKENTPNNEVETTIVQSSTGMESHRPLTQPFDESPTHHRDDTHRYLANVPAELLPPPLAFPTYKPTGDKRDINAWGLHPSIVSAFAEMGIRTLYPWQAECLSSPGVLLDYSTALVVSEERAAEQASLLSIERHTGSDEPRDPPNKVAQMCKIHSHAISVPIEAETGFITPRIFGGNNVAATNTHSIPNHYSFPRNLLYSAPTSGGKTLVSEILLLRTLFSPELLPDIHMLHDAQEEVRKNIPPGTADPGVASSLHSNNPPTQPLPRSLLDKSQKTSFTIPRTDGFLTYTVPPLEDLLSNTSSHDPSLSDDLYNTMHIHRSSLGFGLFVLPYVSLVDEKTAHFEKLCATMPQLFSPEGKTRRHVVGLHGKSERKSMGSAVLGIVTIERALNVLRTLEQEGKLRHLRMVVVDEVHMIGEGDRGALLETFLSTLHYWNKITQFNRERKRRGLPLGEYASVPETNVQIVCMSATLPNIRELQVWLDAALYISNTRPVPLTEYVLTNGQLMQVKSSDAEIAKRDGANVAMFAPPALAAPHDVKIPPPPLLKVLGEETAAMLVIVAETIAVGGQVLVFEASRNKVEQTADALCRGILPYLAWTRRKLEATKGQGVFPTLAPLPSSLEKLEAYNKEEPTRARRSIRNHLLRAAFNNSQFDSQEPTKVIYDQLSPHLRDGISETTWTLCRCAENGVGFHHAGLVAKERVAMEDAFREGTLPVLVATSTLAVGVNLPAMRVIFGSPKKWDGKQWRILDTAGYRQMAGRAGRAGKDKSGDSIVMCFRGEVEAVAKMMKHPIPRTRSAFLYRSITDNCASKGEELQSQKAKFEIASSPLFPPLEGVYCPPSRKGRYGSSNTDIPMFENCSSSSCYSFRKEQVWKDLFENAKPLASKDQEAFSQLVLDLLTTLHTDGSEASIKKTKGKLIQIEQPFEKSRTSVLWLAQFLALTFWGYQLRKEWIFRGPIHSLDNDRSNLTEDMCLCKLFSYFPPALLSPLFQTLYYLFHEDLLVIASTSTVHTELFRAWHTFGTTSDGLQTAPKGGKGGPTSDTESFEETETKKPNTVSQPEASTSEPTCDPQYASFLRIMLLELWFALRSLSTYISSHSQKSSTPRQNTPQNAIQNTLIPVQSLLPLSSNSNRPSTRLDFPNLFPYPLGSNSSLLSLLPQTTRVYLTQAGAATARSGLTPPVSVAIYNDLRHSISRLILAKDLHLLSLLVPMPSENMSSRTIHWDTFLAISDEIGPLSRAVGDIVGVEKSFVRRCVEDPRAFKVNERISRSKLPKKLQERIQAYEEAKRKFELQAKRMKKNKPEPQQEAAEPAPKAPKMQKMIAICAPPKEAPKQEVESNSLSTVIADGESPLHYVTVSSNITKEYLTQEDTAIRREIDKANTITQEDLLRHARYYHALIVWKLLQGESIVKLEAMSKGSIQRTWVETLLQQTIMFSALVVRFAAEMNWWSLAKCASNLRSRLQAKYPKHLQRLFAIDPNLSVLTMQRAEKLFRAGFRSAIEIYRKADTRMLAMIFQETPNVEISGEAYGKRKAVELLDTRAGKQNRGGDPSQGGANDATQKAEKDFPSAESWRMYQLSLLLNIEPDAPAPVSTAESALVDAPVPTRVQTISPPDSSTTTPSVTATPRNPIHPTVDVKLPEEIDAERFWDLVCARVESIQKKQSDNLLGTRGTNSKEGNGSEAGMEFESADEQSNQQSNSDEWKEMFSKSKKRGRMVDGMDGAFGTTYPGGTYHSGSDKSRSLLPTKSHNAPPYIQTSLHTCVEYMVKQQIAKSASGSTEEYSLAGQLPSCDPAAVDRNSSTAASMDAVTTIATATIATIATPATTNPPVSSIPPSPFTSPSSFTSPTKQPCSELSAVPPSPSYLLPSLEEIPIGLRILHEEMTKQLQPVYPDSPPPVEPESRQWLIDGADLEEGSSQTIEEHIEANIRLFNGKSILSKQYGGGKRRRRKKGVVATRADADTGEDTVISMEPTEREKCQVAADGFGKHGSLASESVETVEAAISGEITESWHSFAGEGDKSNEDTGTLIEDPHFVNTEEPSEGSFESQESIDDDTLYLMLVDEEEEIARELGF